MDNLTHSLFGWTLARAGLGRRVPYATATLIVASNAPDVDIVTAARGGVEYLAAHRGPTHGPLGVIGLGLLTAVGVWAWARIRGGAAQRAPDARAGRPFTAWWLLAMAAIVCHALMDLPTSYGTRLLSPFVWTWYAFDWMPIIDVYLWIVLIVALIAGSATGNPRRAAAVALALMAVDYTARAALHERALTNASEYDAAGVRAPCATAPTLVAHPALIEARLAGPDPCVEAAALPTFFSPFTWRTVRQHLNGYEMSDRSALSTREPVHATRIATDSSAEVLRARTTRAGRVYLDFARFPIAVVKTRTANVTAVRLLDARFVGLPWRAADAGARSPLSVLIELDASGRIVQQRLGN